MSERYTRLFTLPEENLYAIGSPIIICAGALLKDTLSGNIIAQLKFRNIGNKTVSALKVSIRTFDIFGKELEGISEYQYLDLAVVRDQEFGQKTPVILPNPDTRSFYCDCHSIVFVDGSVWEAKNANWLPLKKQESLQSRFGDLTSQYQRDIRDSEARFVATKDRDLWLCTCGAINNSEEAICHSCKAKLEVLKTAEDKTLLNEHLQEYLQKEEQARLETERRAEIARAEEARKAEEERIASEKTAKKRKRTIAIVTSIIVACIASVIVLTTVIIPKQKYNTVVARYGQEFVDTFYALNVGDVYKFGSYEQDNNTANGTEDIEWLVLVKESNRILVISRYALDCQQYNTSYTSVTWETCSLRKWLNETFLNAAFSESERAMIPSVTVSADRNPNYSTSPGNITSDQVFLLSITEANKYFTSNSARQCKRTAFCYAQGAYKGDGLWWLRSPGYFSDCAASVYNDGSVHFHGNWVNNIDIAVRPALWIYIG